MTRRPLTEVFAEVPDPRKSRGRRHALSTVLTIAQCAVLAGAKSLVAISEWMVEADRDALSQHGIGPDVVLACESTIRRTLAVLDATGLDRAIAGWTATRVGQVAGRRVIAVDGKTMRGARREAGAPHLVAALDHGTGAVSGQPAVVAKSNEIPALRDLLDTMEITDAVITADAMHCQRETARHITDSAGHCLLTVKANQPALRDKLKASPWKEVPATCPANAGHGRRVRRTIKAIDAPAWIEFPGAAQIVQIRRTRTVKGRKHIEVVYEICSLPMTQAPPATIAAWVQGHWGIENRLHRVRDVVFDEDRYQLRTGHGPQVTATLRNTAISLHRLAGQTCIASASRHHSRDSRRPIGLLTAA